MLASTHAAARASFDHYYPTGINEEQQFSRVVRTPAQVAAYYQSLVDAGWSTSSYRRSMPRTQRRSSCWRARSCRSFCLPRAWPLTRVTPDPACYPRTGEGNGITGVDLAQ